jgi:hypothetical protein
MGHSGIQGVSVGGVTYVGGTRLIISAALALGLVAAACGGGGGGEGADGGQAVLR